MKQVGVKLNGEENSIVREAVRLHIEENVSQVVRAALREFAKNHGIQVKKDE